MAEREPEDVVVLFDDELDLPNCGTQAEQRARSHKYFQLLREKETLGFPPDQLVTDFEENRRAYAQFYQAWLNASLAFDNLLEGGGTMVEHGERTTFLFQPHVKQTAQKLWKTTCDLYQDFCEISRISYETWGIAMDYNDVHWKGFHQDHIDRQQARVEEYIIFTIA